MKRKIIPCLDTRDGQLVKGVNFVDIKELGTPVDYAVKYDQDGADELVLLDITKTEAGHALRLEMIQEVAQAIAIPLTVGGGIGSLEEIEATLGAGAAKVSISSAALSRPEFINEAVARFGSEKIVVAVDMGLDDDGQHYVYSHGGQQKEDRLALEWVEEVVERGAGELLITSVNHDGAKQGFDLPFLSQAKERVEVPIIASGGAGSIEDFVELFQRTTVESGLAASIFHYGEVAIPELKARLQAEGIEVND